MANTRSLESALPPRGLHHAARELLAEHFAALAEDGPRRRVAIEPGPPPTVRTVGTKQARTTG